MKLMNTGVIIFKIVNFVPYYRMLSNIHTDMFLKENIQYCWEVNNVF
jgi:hypothetical protein